MRRSAALRTLLGIALAGGLPRRSVAAEPHVLRYGDGLDVSSLNPLLATTGNTAAFSELTMAHFLRFDPHGTPIPELIVDVPTRANGGISADGKSLTFHLRRGARWSDGAPFDASDVLYSVAVARDSRNNLFVRDPWEKIADVAARGKFTVRFRLKEPFSPFIIWYFASGSASCVLPRHVLGPSTVINTAPYNGLPVGIGPFRYTAYRRGSDVEMEANPHYWRGQPKLERIVYKLIPNQNTLLTQLQTGELDLWQAVSGPLTTVAKGLEGKRWTTWLSNFMSAIYFNTSHPPVSDPRVRRALRLATDRKNVFDKVMLRNGVMTESLIPVVNPDFLALPLSNYDPAAAERMLDEAGWTLGADGVRVKDGAALALDLALPSGYQPSEIFADLLKENWAKVGVRLTIHVCPSAQFFTTYANGGVIETGKFDVALLSQAVPLLYADIAGAYGCRSIAPHGANFIRYCDPDVDALNERYVQTYDRRMQKVLAARIQRLVDRDCPMIEIYERAFVSVFDANLTGYAPNPFSYWGDPLKLDIT